MRLHSLVYAASVDLPMVGIIYDPKVEAMVKELGIEEAVDVENFTPEELFDKTKLALENLEDRRKVLSQRTEEMKQESKRNVEIALDLLGEKNL